MRKKLTVLTIGLAAILHAAPTQAALDEGGGAARAPVITPAADGFDWADAGIGAGIGAVVAAVLGAGAAARRRQTHARGSARPATQ